MTDKNQLVDLALNAFFKFLFIEEKDRKRNLRTLYSSRKFSSQQEGSLPQILNQPRKVKNVP